MTVAAIAIVVALRCGRRDSRAHDPVALTVDAALGIAATLVVLVVVIPGLQHGRRLRLLDQGRRAARPSSTVRATNSALSPGCWVPTTGLLALRSPRCPVVALPTLGWRFLSDRYTYWEPWYQYDAVLVPIAVAAMIEGAIF